MQQPTKDVKLQIILTISIQVDFFIRTPKLGVFLSNSSLWCIKETNTFPCKHLLIQHYFSISYHAFDPKI